ncbi:MAG: transcription antitermination factor NusB [Oscillospiraceae bacterium]|nr:transcription antitermination factor NusB [Oscillospiraceae bacterium]
MTRTNAREIALQILFTSLYNNSSAEELIDARLDEAFLQSLALVPELDAEMPDEAQLSYIRTVVKGVLEDREALDAYIVRYLSGWKLERISRVARAAMELAIYEILHVDDVPGGAAINEAVALCKKYDEPSSASFVNGVLSSVLKEVGEHVSGN